MEFIDTHAHLYASEFEDDVEEIIQRAKNNGIKRIYLPNIDVDTIDVLHKLVEKDPAFFYPMMGLHPCSVTKYYLKELEKVKVWFDKNTYKAVGEIGIDLYWDKTLLKEQQHAFAMQVQWSIDLNLPIVIHARDSFQEIFDVLKQFNPTDLRGVFHCFTGTLADYQTITSLGDFFIGIGGVVTYKKSDLPAVLPHIPISRIILETDAPYLTPVPFRGKRNESSYIPHIAEKLADIYQCTLAEVAKVTTANALQLFGN
ncbi:MAG: TatD DNase family protein [Flavobacteriales bacterium]|jgi:TatD DNase family protein